MKVEASQTQGATTDNRTSQQQLLGQKDFIQLLMAQLQYQNPLEPMKDTEFIAQLAQFSMLEQVTALREDLAKAAEQDSAWREQQEAWQAGRQALDALNLVGFLAITQDLSGPVEAVRLRQGLPYLVIGDSEVLLQEVLEVRRTPAAEPLSSSEEDGIEQG